MKRFLRTLLIAACLGTMLLSLAACGKSAELTAAEQAAAQTVLGETVLTDQTEAALAGGAGAENDAVRKVWLDEAGGNYVFIAEPEGTGGAISLITVIDGAAGEIVAVQILSHKEAVSDAQLAEHTAAYTGRNAYGYLVRTKETPVISAQIRAMDGAVETSDAILDGVNDCIGVFMTLDNPYYALEPGVVAVYGPDGTELGAFSREDLLDLQSYRRKLVIHSSLEGDTTHDFRGVRFSEALALVAPDALDTCSGAFVSGIDGYSAELTMDEIRMENNVFIMYEDNGALIPDFFGEDGALRIVILGDSFGQRFTNVLTEIRLTE